MKKQILHPDTMLVTGLVMFIFMIVSFVLAYAGGLSGQFEGQGRACTEEARICPDGSTITRTGPRCEFSKCPHDALPNRPGITEEPFIVPLPTDKSVEKKRSDTVLCTQEVKICPDGSFVGKSGPKCEFAPCPSDLELDSDR